MARINGWERRRSGRESREWPQKNAKDTKKIPISSISLPACLLCTLRLFAANFLLACDFPALLLIRVHRRLSAVKALSDLIYVVMLLLATGILRRVRRFRRVVAKMHSRNLLQCYRIELLASVSIIPICGEYSFLSASSPHRRMMAGTVTDHPLTFFGTAFAGFFAIMNPIANTPIFLGLTDEMDDSTTRAVAFRALGLAFLIVAAFSLGGNLLLHFFGITLASFRIAGGLLVALVGYHLLQGGHSPVHQSKEITGKSPDDAMSIAVSPLGMPLLAGPGTIVTAMNFAAGGTPARLAIVLAAFFLICVLTYICFMSGHRLTRFLGKSMVMVVSRLMGLILAVIGTQMVIEGVLGVIKR